MDNIVSEKNNKRQFLDALEAFKESAKPKGLRYNAGKLRYDLVPVFAQKEYVRVLTYGANKYTVYNEDNTIKHAGDNNWRHGLPWRSVIASMKRHIEAWERGEDYDFDHNCEECKNGNCKMHSGLLHTAHMMCNAAFLTEYIRIYPQGDNRLHDYLIMPKIGLDIDEVIADFVGTMVDRFPEMNGVKPVYWNDPILLKCFNTVKDDPEFWMSIKPKIDPKSLPFEPHCYITSRTTTSEVTEAWLEKHGFPKAKVWTVGQDGSKLDVAKKSGIEIFIDDRYENFVELNKNGIVCFLLDAAHNQRYKNLGFKRIKSLNDLPCLLSI